MPALGRPPQSFVAIWVEDGAAKLWRVELDTGAMDEIARFASDGLTRTAVLEIARMFIRGRGPDRSVNGELTAPATNGTAPAPVKRKAPGRGTVAMHREEGARQAELLEALKRHPEGISSADLWAELGRPPSQGAGVALSMLARRGLVRADSTAGASAVTGKPVALWYPL